MKGSPRLVVLDRDGVINQDSPQYIKSAAEFKPIPGSIEAIASLSNGGFRVVVASNQSGVGRGLLDHQALLAIHDKLIGLVQAAGGTLAGIYVCPHRPQDDCDCRKPRPGLLLRLAQDMQAELAQTAIIGDSQRDLEAAVAVGGRAMLVRTGNGAATAAGLPAETIIEIFDDLAQAADHLIGESA